MNSDSQQNQPELPNLPNSDDVEVWDGEKQYNHPRPIAICETHTRENWMTHLDYTFKDGVLECTRCPWGTRLPGYMKWLNGKVIDLRSDGKGDS